jgi:hypothetical protein
MTHMKDRGAPKIPLVVDDLPAFDGSGAGAPFPLLSEHAPAPRRWLPALIALLGLAGLVGAGIGIYLTVAPRPLSAAERTRYIDQGVSQNWLTRPTRSLFPATIGYSPDDDKGAVARRVGIAPQAGCAEATDPQAARILAARGCVAVLRATYVDESAAFAVTVGVAVMPTFDAAGNAESALDHAGDFGPGVRAVGFPHTVTDLFGDAQREITQVQASGPYVILTAAGYTDGRARGTSPEKESMANALRDLWPQLAAAVGHQFMVAPSVPHCTWGHSC